MLTNCHSANGLPETTWRTSTNTAHDQETPDLESSSDAYARRFAGAVGEYFLKVQWDMVRRMIPSPDCQVLDVGGGHGQLTVPLLQEGFTVTVFGSAAAGCARLDQLVGGDGYRFVAGDLLALPFASNSFDVVLAFRLVPHLERWQQFIRELCRVAKRAVILDYPDRRSVNWFSRPLFALKKGIEQNTRRYRCFRKDEILGAFRSSQFTQCEFNGQFLFPMALHRMMRTAVVSKCLEGVSRTVGLTQLFGSPVIVKASPI